MSSLESLVNDVFDTTKVSDKANEVKAHKVTFEGMIKSKQSAYSDLLKEADSLSDLIDDPEIRLQVALRKMNCPPGAYLNALEMHANDLLERRAMFTQNATKSLIQQRIENLEKQRDDLYTENAKYKVEIEDLQEKITELNRKININGGVIGRLTLNIEESTRDAKTPLDIALEQVMDELGRRKQLFSCMS